IQQTHASVLTSYSVSIGDSRAGVATYHNYKFNTPSTTAIKTITFQYCTTASGSCTAPTGMVLTASPTLGTVTGIAGSGYTAAGSSGTCTGSGNSNCTITLTVGTPSTQTGGATVAVPVVLGITNPTPTNTTFFVRITTVDGSSATIDGPSAPAFAILTSTSIAVSASVDPTLSFSIAGINGDGVATVNGATLTNGVNSSATAVPFGTLTANTAVIAAQDLTVTTNASSGYSITASASATPPLSSGSDNIDTFNDSGASNASPATWSAPAGGTANIDTGYFGYTTNDSSLCTGTGSRFTSSGGNKWAGTTTTGQEVACSTTGVSSETTRIGYETEVNNIQPAGSYTGTVILIATPTY
ncbi:MAG TPA: hypothetical protein VNZ86_02020, partial [Bacteroidia bacterium]|nr:hypothetical protein [Bacteroidia bacterium]